MTKAKRNRLIYNIVTFALVIGAFLILQSMIESKTITRSLKSLAEGLCVDDQTERSRNMRPSGRYG